MFHLLNHKNWPLNIPKFKMWLNLAFLQSSLYGELPCKVSPAWASFFMRYSNQWVSGIWLSCMSYCCYNLSNEFKWVRYTYTLHQNSPIPIKTPQYQANSLPILEILQDTIFQSVHLYLKNISILKQVCYLFKLFLLWKKYYIFVKLHFMSIYPLEIYIFSKLEYMKLFNLEVQQFFIKVDNSLQVIFGLLL